MTDKNKTAKTNKTTKTTKTIKNKKREVTEMENEKQNETKNVDIALQKGTWFKETAELMTESETDKKEVRWTSSNPQVAAVNEENGHIYGKGIGEAEITATAADGTTEQFAVSVTSTPVLVSAIKITYPGGKLIRRGKSFWCKAEVFPANATNKTLRWSSSNMMGIFMDSDGQAAPIGMAEDPITIGVSATDGSGVHASRSVSSVDFNPIHSITLGPEHITLPVGESFLPIATVCTENATYPCVRWSTSDPSVVTVNFESGLLMGQSVGTATVTATAIDGSDVKASCVVNVCQYVDIPEDGNLGTVISYEGYHLITSPTSNQYRLKQDAQSHNRYSISNPEYFAMIDDRILIATKQNIGNQLAVEVGDYVDVTFVSASGVSSEHRCIIGDIKSDGDAPNIWGHYNGQGVVEVIYHDYAPPAGYNANRNNPWGKGRVTRITKVGRYEF